MGDRPELTTTVVVTLTAVSSHSHSHSSRESQSTAVSKVSEIRPLEYSRCKVVHCGDETAWLLVRRQRANKYYVSISSNVLTAVQYRAVQAV